MSSRVRSGAGAGLSLAGGFLAVAGVAVSARAVQVTYDLPVLDMDDFVISGSPQVGQVGPDNNVFIQFGPIGESRGVFEFDLSAVPAGAALQSATLNYNVNLLQINNNGPIGQRLGFFAYAGDGVAAQSDTSGGGTRVATTAMHLNNGSYAQPLDLAAIQNVVGQSPAALGLWAWAEDGNNLGVGIHHEAFPPENKPTLSLVAEISRQGTLSTAAAVDALASQPTYGGAWTVTDGDNSVSVRDAEIINQHRRSILEFAVPDTPTGSIVTGGRLTLNVSSFTSGGGEFPSAAAHLYLGDGQATVGDATALSVPWSSSGNITSTGALSIELPRQSLQFAVDQGVDFLGALLRSDSGTTDFASFNTTEFATLLNDPTRAPMLELDYAILDGAIPGDANLDEVVNLTDANTLVAAYTGSLAADEGDAIWLDGDFDFDGDVDFADALVLRRNFTGSVAALDAALARVPEPAGMILLSGIAGLMLRRRV